MRRVRAAYVSAGIAFVMGSVTSMVMTTVVPTPGVPVLVAQLRGALVAMVGVVILLLPWERWHPRTTLVIPAVALVSLTSGDYMQRFSSAGTGQRLLPVIYMLIFVWLGMMHGRWWPLRVLPLAACGYLYAACLAPDPDAARITALVFLPIAVLLGEVIAWVLDRLDSAQDRDAARIRSLERLADATFELHESALLDAPRVAASSAAAVLDSDGVLVAIRSGDDVLRGTAGAAPQLSADDVGVLLCGGTTAPQNALVVPLRPPGPYAAVLVAKATNSRDEFTSNVARLLGMQFGSAIARLQQVSSSAATPTPTRSPASATAATPAGSWPPSDPGTPSCSSTSTTSRASTTPSGTRRGTRSCASWGRTCPERSVRRTARLVTAARSSWSCCAAARASRRGPPPNGCAEGGTPRAR